MPKEQNQNQEPGESLSISIGVVSSACDIPISTLRTWERRYGFPSPIRTPGNQRLYNPNVIDQLKLIRQALCRGHRPGQVVPLNKSQLNDMLGMVKVVEPPLQNKDVMRWLKATKELDESSLGASFLHCSRQLGLEQFIIERLCPFISALGTEWMNGNIKIFQEHFASECIHDFLTSSWRSLSNHSDGPFIVCATLPGEQHNLGLHMATAIAALNNFRIIFLGPKTPQEEVLECVNQTNAVAVLISVSIASDLKKSKEMLTELRSNLTDSVNLIVGGLGSSHELIGVQSLGSLSELSSWAEIKRKNYT